MRTFHVRNAQQALPEISRALLETGVRRDSRNGPVLMFEDPVGIEYRKPTERVVFYPERDANPFFHLFESFWMLAGREDVAFPASIVPNMKTFSDDGETFNGAYGQRWRRHFGRDQIRDIVDNLKHNPDCRRQVLQMWSATDLGSASKDVPCNTQIYFSRNADGDLDMTVLNRSNDLIWGALGANVVHMSVLQESVAQAIGCGVGRYVQFSNNLHVYVDRHGELLESLAEKASMAPGNRDPYAMGQVVPLPIGAGGGLPLATQVVSALDKILQGDSQGFGELDRYSEEWRFGRDVVKPMIESFSARRIAGKTAALAILGNANQDIDWIRTSTEWIERRK